MSSNNILGLDFGCAFSIMSAFNEQTHSPIIICDKQRERKTPSLCFFDAVQKNVQIGFSALNILEEINGLSSEERINYENGVFTCLKRFLIRNSERYLSSGDKVTPFDAATELLSYFRKCAQENHFHQEVDALCLAYPVMYSDSDRQLLTKAASNAGFSETILVPEPIAAVMGYEAAGLSLGNNVLLYDFGAGSFTVSFVHKDENGRYSMPCGFYSLKNCSGFDLDLAICNYLNQKFDMDFTGLTTDISFLWESHLCRERLSKNTSASFSHYSMEFDRNIRMQLSREEFDILAAPFVTRTLLLLKDMEEKVISQGYDVNAIVLNGGCIKTPLVQQELEKLSQNNELKTPIINAFNEEAIALGASCFAQNRNCADINADAKRLETGISVNPAFPVVETAAKHPHHPVSSQSSASQQRTVVSKPQEPSSAQQFMAAPPSPVKQKTSQQAQTAQFAPQAPNPASMNSGLVPHQPQQPAPINPQCISPGASTTPVRANSMDNMALQSGNSYQSLLTNPTSSILAQMSMEQWNLFIQNKQRIHNNRFYVVREILRNIWDQNDVVSVGCDLILTADQLPSTVNGSERAKAYWRALYDIQFPTFQILMNSFWEDFSMVWSNSLHLIPGDCIELSPEELSHFQELFTIPPAEASIIQKRMINKMSSLETLYGHIIQLHEKLKEKYKSLKSLLEGGTTSTFRAVTNLLSAFGDNNQYQQQQLETQAENMQFANEFDSLVREYYQAGSNFATTSKEIITTQINLLEQYWDNAFYNMLPVYAQLAEIGFNVPNINREIYLHRQNTENSLTQKDHNVLSNAFERLIDIGEISPAVFQSIVQDFIETGYCFNSDGSINQAEYNKLPTGLSEAENNIIDYKNEFQSIINSAQWKPLFSDSELFFAGNIPNEKVASAINSYGANNFSSDNILVLFDSTIFGTASEGFVITFMGLSWHNDMWGEDHNPHFVAWDEIDNLTIGNDKKPSMINNMIFRCISDTGKLYFVFDVFRQLTDCSKNHAPLNNGSDNGNA